MFRRSKSQQNHCPIGESDARIAWAALTAVISTISQSRIRHKIIGQEFVSAGIRRPAPTSPAASGTTRRPHRNTGVGKRNRGAVEILWIRALIFLLTAIERRGRVAYVMTTKKPQTVTIWRLRVPLSLVAKVKKLAEQEHRSVTKQAQVLLEEAISGK